MISRRLFWFALALGLAVRFMALGQTAGLDLHIADERQYVQLATSLLDGRGFAWATGQPTSLRPPAYPALLAAIWSVTGPGNLQAVRLIQILLALVTAGVAYELARRVFDTGTGRLAAAIVWLYPPLAYLNFTILTETLFTLLLSSFVLTAVALAKQPRATTAAACGVTLGLGALVRSVLWPLPLALLPLLLVVMGGPIRRRIGMCVLVLLGYAVVVVPWAVRNTRLQGVTTVVDTMGGLNLRMGNYEHTPEDRMWDAVSMTGEKSWVYALTLEGHPAGDAITEGQKDKWAQRKALEYMAGHPATTLRRAAIKFTDFWGIDRSYVAAVQQGLYTPPVWLAGMVAVLMAGSSASLILLAAAGIWIARPDWRMHVLLLLPVAAVTAVHTLVFGHPRYHLPLVPILAVYVAALVARGHPRAWLADRPAIYGAVLLALIVIAGWARQIFVVDGDRIRAFLENL